MKKLFPLTIYVFSAAFVFPGCSVFSPVGDVLSHVYENTVSYFNIYYNARRAFHDAEDDIHTATMAAKSKGQLNQPFVVSVAARQKLNVVIDKCSSILSLHSTSSFVDNALMLIGKSYFYLGEYVKAERKFTELIDQYPTSSFALEARLWHARVLEQLDRLEEAIVASEVVLREADNEHEGEVEGEAHLLLGSIYEQRDEKEKAVAHYIRVTEVAEDDDVRAEAQMKAANLLFEAGDYKRAVPEYAMVKDFTSDVEMIFHSRLQSVIALRELKEFEKAWALTDELLDDIRFKGKSGTIRFERANILHAEGKKEQAIDEYRDLDTTFARSEVGSLAAFALGNIFEKELGDYYNAKQYYSRVAETRVPGIYETAVRKASALGRYIDIRTKSATVDSLLRAWSEVSSVTDSTRPPNADSLKNAKAGLMYEVAELFQGELMEPDSSYFWYRQSLTLSSDSVRNPRILFILAELAQGHQDGRFGSPNDYYREVVVRYPRSKYAEQARIILNMPVAKKEVDPSEKLYAQAESLIDLKQYEKAIVTLKGIGDQFPGSAFAAKSEYAVGWLYENQLSKPDSALVHYKRLVERHGKSNYAAIVKPRIENPQTAPKDSLEKKPSVPPQNEDIQNPNGKRVPMEKDTDADKTKTHQRKEKQE